MSGSRKRKKRRKLRVAHIVPVTPHKCGMYETARELVVAERRLGVNAHLVDPRPSAETLEKMKAEAMKKNQTRVKVKCPKCETGLNLAFPAEAKGNPRPRVKDWFEDRGASAAPFKFAMDESDVLVSHSGIFGPLEKESKAPAIHVAHGWPRSSFLIEWQGGTGIYKEYLRMGKVAKYQAFVTFWPEYREYLELLFPPEKLRVMPAFVDLDAWKVDGKADYDFGGRRGDINVVCADIWRTTKDPYYLMNAFMVFAKRHPDEKVKLHMYGCNEGFQAGWATLIKIIEDNGWRGEMQPAVSHMSDIYHSMDMALTNINSASRVVREAMACGRQVVAGHDCQWTPYNAYEQDLGAYADAMDAALADWRQCRAQKIRENRLVAEQNFDVMETAKGFVGMFEEITGRKAA